MLVACVSLSFSSAKEKNDGLQARSGRGGVRNARGENPSQGTSLSASLSPASQPQMSPVFLGQASERASARAESKRQKTRGRVEWWSDKLDSEWKGITTVDVSWLSRGRGLIACPAIQHCSIFMVALARKAGIALSAGLAYVRIRGRVTRLFFSCLE